MNTRELFRSDDLPVFQNKMFDSEIAACSCQTGDLVLVQDMETGLVFNEAFDANLMDYDDSYQNEQACSDTFRQHIGAVAKIIDRHCFGKTILEIGCGKGFFLQHLLDLGYRATGVDPAYEGSSPHVIRALFGPELGLTGDVLVLRHVLEHVWKPLDFLSRIVETNGGKGLIYIEVPCLEWICRNHAWFDIFYEHVNYFRLDDFFRMFGTVHEAGHLFGGQYLYAIADLGSFGTPSFSASIDFPADFLFNLDSLVTSLLPGKRRAIWGAAAKGMMLAYFLKRSGVSLEFAIDINPAKQGKFLGGSGLRVVSPSHALDHLESGDEIFVMNSNYLDEIVTLSENVFTYLQVDRNGLF